MSKKYSCLSCGFDAEVLTASMVVYLVTNINTGKKYVGKTKKTFEDRFDRHLYEAFELKLDRYFLASIRKHGQNAWNAEILQQCYSEQELNERETYWIMKLSTYKPNIGYNRTMGGDGGLLTPEACAKISKANKGRVLTPEDRAKKSAAAKGRKLSPETIALITKIIKARPPPTEETRRKMSIAHTNPSAETRQKMSEAAKRRWAEVKKNKEQHHE